MKTLIKFTNCKILRYHKILNEDIWVRNGMIVNPEKVFFDEKVQPDAVIDCEGCIISPGFIDIQINGGFGYDFSYDKNTEKSVNVVAKNLLAHGVTSFCPTIVTSSTSTYKNVLPKLGKRNGGQHGATILGAHVEGPFINIEKKGAHEPNHIKAHNGHGLKHVEAAYGSFDNIKIVTLAPELENSSEVIKMLTEKKILVSVGHSTANLAQAEEAVKNGASLITHLFNAMLPFHHRDPGLVGLLASNNIPSNQTIYFGIISDGVHTHPAALRIAYRVHPEVTDAISALGLEDGKHHIGELEIEVRQSRAYIAGTNTLCGSIANMLECVRIFITSTKCSLEYALEAASLHPARALGITTKGSLDFGADADFVMLNDKLELKSTWIAGEKVYTAV